MADKSSIKWSKMDGKTWDRYQETDINRDLERKHLDIAKKRRDEIRSGKVQPIDGEEALASVRRMVQR